ncbi:PIN domain-containing protein [Candidatus Gottesmanbacteria bacterium]|nr:PIN domain-containing protein [Candidatus Gottesmanbacteria bacterium]
MVSKTYIFVDSSMWKTLVDPKDDFYQKASKIWERLKQENVRLLTTNYILDEAFTLIRARCGINSVKLLRDNLVSDWKAVKIIRVLTIDEGKAWNWFLKDWSNLSFTDCVSFAVMERLALKRVATFDQHFARAGFKIE